MHLTNYRNIRNAFIAFMFAFFILKLSQVFFLEGNDYSHLESIELVTSTFSIFAISSIVWGLIADKFLPRQTMLLVGLITTAIAFIILALPFKQFYSLAFASFSIGSSLFYNCIQIESTNLVKNSEETTTVSKMIQRIMNIGPMFAIIFASFYVIEKNYSHFNFEISCIIAITALFMSGFSILKLEQEKCQSSLSGAIKVLCILSALVLIATILLSNFQFIIRAISVVTYILGLMWFYTLSRLKRESIASFLLILLTCSLVYWLSSLIFYTYFIKSLNNSFEISIYGIAISGVVLMLADPVFNFLFGTFFIKKGSSSVKRNIIYALLLLTLSFLLVLIGANTASIALSSVFFFVAIAAFAAAEFLSQSTIRALAKTLFTDNTLSYLAFTLSTGTKAIAAVTLYALTYSIEHYEIPLNIYSNLNIESRMYLAGLSICVGASLVFSALFKIRNTNVR